MERQQSIADHDAEVDGAVFEQADSGPEALLGLGFRHQGPRHGDLGRTLPQGA